MKPSPSFPRNGIHANKLTKLVEEYWIVDTKRREITVYNLSGKRFGRAKVYTAKDTIRSRVLRDFTLLVKGVFA